MGAAGLPLKDCVRDRSGKPAAIVITLKADEMMREDLQRIARPDARGTPKFKFVNQTT